MGFKRIYRIPLTQGEFALVDGEDYSNLVKFWWHTIRREDGRLYVSRAVNINGKKTTELIHRRIMKAPLGVEVDHKNGNGLDNRRGNLRLASGSNNQWNQGKNCRNTSGYKGVY